MKRRFNSFILFIESIRRSCGYIIRKEHNPNLVDRINCEILILILSLVFMYVFVAYRISVVGG